MPRIEDEDLVRVHVWLFNDDVEVLRSSSLVQSLGFSKAIRMMVRKFLRNLDAKTQAKSLSHPTVSEVKEILVSLSEEERLELKEQLAQDGEPNPND